MAIRLITLMVLLFPFSGFAADSFYCPQNSSYIYIGMSAADVVAACGEPKAKVTTSQSAVKQRVPVRQLIYSTLNRGSVYPGLNAAIYETWSLPSGSTGNNMEVDIINQKIAAIRINGSDSNASTICRGISFAIGDDENRVYAACDRPDLINNTYIYQIIPSNQKPEIWVYQVDQYQSQYRLTFVNGKLQSID